MIKQIKRLLQSIWNLLVNTNLPLLSVSQTPDACVDLKKKVKHRVEPFLLYFKEEIVTIGASKYSYLF